MSWTAIERKTYPPWIWIILRRRGAQQLIVKVIHILVAQQAESLGVCRTHGCVAVDVAAKAARVRPRTVGARVPGDVPACCGHIGRPEADNHAAAVSGLRREQIRDRGETLTRQKGPR